MNYKSYSPNSPSSYETLFDAEEEFSYKTLKARMLSTKETSPNEAHFQFQSLFKEMLSSDEKGIILKEICDEVSNSKHTLFPAFREGNFLIELLNIFNLEKPFLTKLVIQIFQNLLLNDSRFASFVMSYANSFIYQLLIYDSYYSDLFLLFSLIIITIPDFADLLHSNEIISLLFQIELSNYNVELAQRISILVESLISKQKLIVCNGTDECLLDCSLKLCGIARNLTNFVISLLQKDKNEKNKSKYISSILRPTLLLIRELVPSKMDSAQQLFDYDIGNMISLFLSKGYYINIISDILILFARNYPQDITEFSDDFVILSSLFRHGQRPEYKFVIIKVLIEFAKASMTISNYIFEYGYFEIIENEMKSFSSNEKELVFRLFCILSINIPNSMVEIRSFGCFYQDCFDYCEAASDEFNILFLRATLAVLHTNFKLYKVFDTSELYEKMQSNLVNAKNQEIAFLSKDVLNCL